MFLCLPLTFLYLKHLVSALKLRYLLPVQIPSQVIKPSLGFGASSLPSAPTIARKSSSTVAEPSVFFDAKLVARKENNWEEMLKSVLVLWIQKAVDERRLYQ